MASYGNCLFLIEILIIFAKIDPVSLTCFKTVSGDIKPFWSKYKLMWGFFRLTIIIIIKKKMEMKISVTYIFH